MNIVLIIPHPEVEEDDRRVSVLSLINCINGGSKPPVGNSGSIVDLFVVRPNPNLTFFLYLVGSDSSNISNEIGLWSEVEGEDWEETLLYTLRGTLKNLLDVELSDLDVDVYDLSDDTETNVALSVDFKDSNIVSKLCAELGELSKPSSGEITLH